MPFVTKNFLTNKIILSVFDKRDKCQFVGLKEGNKTPMIMLNLIDIVSDDYMYFVSLN